MLRRHSLLVCFAALLLIVAMTGVSRAGLVDFSSKLMAYAQDHWGREAVPRMLVWQRLTRDFQATMLAQKQEVVGLREVNGFFNQIPYLTDVKHWGVADYWATPIEMLSSFGGDCEDYSISKYLSLKEIGVPVSKLRITYVRALKLGESHMVLAYYPTPDADPLILDNLIGDIRPASQRTDLEPVYGFNDDDLWVTGMDASKGGASNVRLWRQLLEKLAKEQAM